MAMRLEIAGPVYLDSNIFIYAIEGSEVFSHAVENVFYVLSASSEVPWTSELTIAECLIGARKAKSELLEASYLGYFSKADAVHAVPVSRAIIIAAARQAGDANMRLADAVHVATALAADCVTFITNDLRLRLPPHLRKLVLRDLAGEL